MIFLKPFIVLLAYLAVVRAQVDVYEVDIGTNVNLKCALGSQFQNVPTKYLWFDPQNKLRGSTINMIIPMFSFQNQGTYTCQATQLIDGKEVSTKKSILVKAKRHDGDKNDFMGVLVPKLRNTFATGILFLMCKSSKNSDMNYNFEWTTPSGQVQKSNTFFKNRMYLSDSGRYVCKMTRKSDGAVAEGYTIVTVDELPLNISIISGSAVLGQSAFLKCELNKTKLENTVYTKFSYVWEDEKNEVISNSEVVEIKFDDISKFGRYRCKITALSMSPPYEQSQTIELKLINDKTMSSSNSRARNIRDKTTIYTAKITSTPVAPRYFEAMELTCGVIPSLNNIAYQMSFNYVPLTASNKYTIEKLTRAHIGIYTCSINGQDPQTGQSVKLNTEYSITPHFLTSSKIELSEPPGPQIFVHNGDKRELHCEIEPGTSYRGSDAVWSFNGTKLNQNDLTKYNLNIIPRIYVSMALLRNIQPHNEGKYECQVGDKRMEVYIFVEPKNRTIEVSPEFETRKVGDNKPVEFHCSINGYQTKNRDLKWSFLSNQTGQITDIDSGWERYDSSVADETSFIVLMNAKLIHSGKYICVEPQTKNSAAGVLYVTDEADNLGVVVTPEIVRIEAGQSAKIQCHTVNPGRNAAYPNFVQETSGRSVDSPRTTTEKLEAGKIQLTFHNVTINDNGTKFTCQQGRSSAAAIVLVTRVCDPGLRFCGTGTCINWEKFCNGIQDCGDNSDENQQICPAIVVTPKIVRIEAGDSTKIQCYTKNIGKTLVYPEVVQILEGVQINSSRMTIEKFEPGKIEVTLHNSTISDNGTRFTFSQGRLSGESIVLVSPPCPPGLRICQNGICKNWETFCDGKQDCDDGSDEDPKFCPQLVVVPQVVRIDEGQNAEVLCYTKNIGRSSGYAEFAQILEGVPINNMRTTIEKFEIGKMKVTLINATMLDNGTKFTFRQGRLSGEAVIIVSKVCPSGFRHCRNGTCITLDRFCDGKQDCGDGSDEDQQFCPGIVVTPRIVRIETGQTARIQCYTVNTGRNVTYPELNQTAEDALKYGSRTTVAKLGDGKIQLNFRDAQLNDNGTRFIFRHGRLSAEAIVLVSPVCAVGFRYCRNGTCINSAKFCDGTRDCTDGSDEDPQFCKKCDPIVKQCEVHNGEKPIKTNYQAHWVCDGDDDCGNGFDESKCFGNYLDCGGLSYQCDDKNKTIPRAFICDKEPDCDNGEDEASCVVPTILSETPQSYNLNYRQGQTVEIICQVTGYPLPRIIWRFNWGCLPEDGRVTVENSNKNCTTSVSTLKISNFQPGDDGIYTCEALSSGKRAWSKEYQLFMNF